MIRLGSLQKDYDFYVSSDPAFIRLPKDASEEDRKAYAAKWKAARETGDYSPLLVTPDAQPTKFVLGRVKSEIWRQLQDRASLPLSEPLHLGFVTMMALFARLALRAIPSLDMKLEHKMDSAWGFSMAPADVVDVLDSTDTSIVAEIGTEVLRRISQVRGDDPS